MEAEDSHDSRVLETLTRRDGQVTRVDLEDGRQLLVWNIAWGYDLGEDSAHVTSNASPCVNGASLDVFWTNEVVALADAETAEVLLRRG